MRASSKKRSIISGSAASSLSSTFIAMWRKSSVS